MTDQADRIDDVVVIGGGPAGLSAALTLARARRSVTVVDAGQPRNAPAAAVHGLLGLEGVSPVELLARGRDEVRSYGGEIVAGEVVGVSHASDGFAVPLRDGTTLRARRLLIATGLVDELPEIPGVREQWGRGALHCPYCHGWEVRDRRVGVLGTDPMAVHKAVLFHQWSRDIVFFDDGKVLDVKDEGTLDALGVAVVSGTISRLEVDEDRVTGVRIEDGPVVAVDAVVVSARMVARTEIFAGIGIEPTAHPAGAFIETDQYGATSVPGVWAAGNSSDLGAQVGAAAAAGALAAQHINTDLIMTDLASAVVAAGDEGATRNDEGRAAEHTFDDTYWDQVWTGARASAMGSSQPNPHLVREIGDLAPGTALDAGCGAGAEAIWLAEHGWQVTGTDIADAALDRAAERAADAGVIERVTWVQADLCTWAPDTRYDLVTTHYAHPAMPQLEFYDRIATWVAPGGSLLIVGHLHHDATAGGHAHRHEPHSPPASASATAAAITARLDAAEWEVVTAEESHRAMPGPGGHGATIHDVVVRATRRS